MEEAPPPQTPNLIVFQPVIPLAPQNGPLSSVASATSSMMPLVAAHSSAKLFVPAKSPVLIPNFLKSVVSMPPSNSVPMDCSSDDDNSNILTSCLTSFRGLTLPSVVSSKIPVVSKIKVLRHSCGVAKSCFYCKAMRWPAENITTMACCSDGTVRLDKIRDPPEPLFSLLNGTHQKSSHFKTHLREYNCAFQMASSTAQVADAPPGISAVIMSGRLYHRIGPLFPQSGIRETYAQLFLLDSNDQATACKNIFANLDDNLLLELVDMMHDNNHYVHEFEYQTKRSTANATITIPTYWGKDKTYRTPSAPEIAAAIPSHSGNIENIESRQIILYKKGGALQTIKSFNAAFEPLHFVLLFPGGEEGWHPRIPLIENPEKKIKRKNPFVTRKEYFKYRVQIRPDQFPILQLSGRLFQEWMVEMYMAWEEGKLDWLRNNQHLLRSDTYNAVRDAVSAGERDPASIGQRVYLPASFTGVFLYNLIEVFICFLEKYRYLQFYFDHRWTSIHVSALS